jgi:hypothetical protein
MARTVAQDQEEGEQQVWMCSPVRAQTLQRCEG